MESFVIQLTNDILDKNVILSYIAFFISNVLQLVFPPHPADVVMILQGYITTKSNYFNYIPVLLNAITATFLGSYIVYKFGYVKGDSVFEYKFIKKYIKPKHRKRAEKLFEKYGSFAIMISKFVPGVNVIMILLSGVFKMKKSVVYSSVLVSALVHHNIVLVLGRFLGDNITHVNKIMKTYNGIVLGLLAVLVVAFIVFKVLKKEKIKAQE